jgi:hypothetical protein
MADRPRTVWDNVPARAQASKDGSVLDGLTGTLGKQAEQGVQRGVKEYLDTKGDALIADLVGRVKLVVTLTGGALIYYVVKKSGEKK